MAGVSFFSAVISSYLPRPVSGLGLLDDSLCGGLLCGGLLDDGLCGGRSFALRLGIHVDASQPLDLTFGHQTVDGVKGGANHVERIAAADDLCQHVGNPGRLHHGADAAAGNHAGTRRCRPQQHLGRTPASPHEMGHGAAHHGDLDHFFACLFARLLDCRRHFTGLARTVANLAGPVAGHHNRGEGEVFTALDNLCDAVDMNDCFGEFGLSVHHLDNP